MEVLVMEDSASGSPAVTRVSAASPLRRLVDRLSSSRRVALRAEEAPAVAVVALRRCLSEQQQQQQDSYSYDVTITDGLCRTKCLLDASLNHLVHVNVLRTGADIHVTRCAFVYDERRVGHAYIRLEAVSCGAGASAVLTRVRDVTSLVPLLPLATESSDAPLLLSRKHYLPLWNNDDPEGGGWSSAPPPGDTVLDVSKISLISSLESSFRSSWKPLPLLVRILHKSRLRYYGRFGLRIDLPYQAYFEVADQSGTMSLVLWNHLCPEFYQRMNVGTVLYLQNYSLKQSYSKRTRPQMDQYGLRSFNAVEICLNPRDPAALVTVVSPQRVVPQWGLPEVSYRFSTRWELEGLSHNSVCDVIGLVTFVGRVERVKKEGGTGPEKHWTYRWIHAMDGTSEHPFILEVFSCSNPDIFNRISPMTYVVCTQMRLCQVDGSLPYLSSSCETEMFITGHHKGRPYVREPKVKNFLQWTKTLNDDDVLRRTAVGGHYCYPPPPSVFTQPGAEGLGQVPLVSASDLKRELETLQYREHKKLAIQGQITAVRYMKSPKSPELRLAADGRVLDVSSEAREDDGAARRLAAPQTAPAPSAAAAAAAAAGETSPSRTRRACKRNAEQSSGRTQAKRTSARWEPAHEEAEAEEEEEEHGGGEQDGPSWRSSSWLKQHQDVTQHLLQGGLYQDSISRRFSVNERDVLLQWSNLHPAQWTPELSRDPPPPVLAAGHYQLTILGINKQLAVDAAFFPVVRASEPRAAGLPQDPHANTLLSCLASGFLCPLSDAADHSEATPPGPEDLLASGGELEDAHVVCVLELCQLGGDQVEVLLSKVYPVSQVSLH